MDDKNKKKKKSTSPFDVWPPPRDKEKEETDREKRDFSKPRNKSYVDRYEEMMREMNSPVHEGDEDTEKMNEQKLREEEEELRSRTDPYFHTNKSDADKNNSEK